MAEEDVTLLAHIRAIDDGASEIFGNVKAAAGTLGGALVGMYQQSIGSALKYGEAVEKVAFLTGESTKQSSGLIAAFRAQGFTTEEATTSMQRLTGRLGGIDMQFRSTGKLSASAKQQLHDMGITVQDLTKHGGDLSYQLPKIIEHLKNMKDPLERDKLAMQLFGRNFASVAPLIEAGGAAFTAAEADANRFGVALSEDQIAALHKYKSAMETTKEAIQGISLQIAFQALPYFQKLEDVIKQGIAWWDHLSPSVHKTALEIVKLVAVFGPLIGGGAAIQRVVLPLVKEVPLLGQAFEMLLGPLAPLLGIIGPLIALFILLRNEYEHSIVIQKAFAPVINGVKFAFEELKYIWDQVVSIAVDFFNALSGGSRAGLDNFIASLAGPLINALGQVHVFLGQVMIFLQHNHAAIVSFAGVIRGVVANALVFLHQALAVIVQVAEYLWSKTWPALQSAMVQIRPVIAQIVGIWKDDLLPAIQESLPFIELVAKLFVAALGVAIPIAIQVAVTAIKVVIDIIQLVAIQVKYMVKIIDDLVHGNWKQAWADAQALVREMVPAVMHLLNDLWSGIVAIFGGLWNAISAYVGGLVNNIVKFFTDLGAKANSIWSDFANRPIYWIVYLAAKAVEFILGLNVRIGQILLDLGGKALKFGIQFAGYILQEIPKLPGQIATWLGHVAQTVLDAIPGLMKNGTKMATDFINAVLAMVATMPGKVAAFIAQSFGNAGGQVKKALHDAGVPGFAQGAVVGPGFGGARMAVVGEGNEAEVIAKASSLIKAGMQAASGGGGFGGGGGGMITIEYHVDGRLIERRTSRITGKRMRLQGAGTGSAA